jgi:hypothetical protein
VTLGYPDEWIWERLKNVVVHTDLTTEWSGRGAEEGREFATLADVLHTGTLELTTAARKQVQRLKSRHNLRDSMTTLEFVLSSLAEATSAAIHQARDNQGFIELQRDVHHAGGIAGAARRAVEATTGQPVVSAENHRTLRQGTPLRTTPAAAGHAGRPPGVRRTPLRCGTYHPNVV